MSAQQPPPTSTAAAPPAAPDQTRAVSFQLGRLAITPGAQDELSTRGINPQTLLNRHQSGDWGDVSADDREANEDGLRTGARIFSVYKIAADEKVWIITDGDDEAGTRHATTILLPSDY